MYNQLHSLQNLPLISRGCFNELKIYLNRFLMLLKCFSQFFLINYVKLIQIRGVDRISKNQGSKELEYFSCFLSALKLKLVYWKISSWSYADRRCFIMYIDMSFHPSNFHYQEVILLHDLKYRLFTFLNLRCTHDFFLDYYKAAYCCCWKRPWE